MQVLLAIHSHLQLRIFLSFKGGTSLMLFHGLTWFSTDLDFNILDISKTEYLYRELRILLLRLGIIDDEVMKVCACSLQTLMQGLGKVLMDNVSKNFARKDLIAETASGLELFATYMLIAEKND